MSGTNGGNNGNKRPLLSPAVFPLGSMESRAAARLLLEKRPGHGRERWDLSLLKDAELRLLRRLNASYGDGSGYGADCSKLNREERAIVEGLWILQIVRKHSSDPTTDIIPREAFVSPKALKAGGTRIWHLIERMVLRADAALGSEEARSELLRCKPNCYEEHVVFHQVRVDIEAMRLIGIRNRS